MNPAKKLLALILSISILVSVCPTFNVTFTAETDENGAETTTEVSKNFITEYGDIVSAEYYDSANAPQTTICNDTLYIYENYENAHGVQINNVLGTQIWLEQCIVYSNGKIVYRYSVIDSSHELSDTFRKYQFIEASDVTPITNSGSTDEGETPETEKCQYCGVELVEGAEHKDDCLSLCTCTPVDGVHQSGCKFYVCANCNQNPCVCCTTCGKVGCTSTHATWCTICQKDDCGLHCTLDFLPAELIAESADVQGTTATINSTSIRLYKSLDNNANGIVVSVEAGTQINIITKYTFTKTDGTTLVFYRYEYTGTNTALADAAFSEYSGYVFVYAGDISVDETSGGDSSDETLVQTDTEDESTGVSISAKLPADVTLSVISKTLADSGIDTNLYPVGDASLFYDVTLYQNSTEYQPTEGITITFPETAITASGLAVGDYYKVYHVHDGEVEVGAATLYNGGDIVANFDSLSVVGVASTESINPTTVFGAYQGKESYTGYAVIKTDSVIVYGDVIETETTDYIEYSGVKGLQIELSNYKVMYENANLYYYTYSGDEKFQSGYFIPEEYITFTCCYNCTGASGCTCGCDSCECNTTTTETTLTDDTNNTGITVTGVIPEEVMLSVTPLGLSDFPAFVDTSFIDWHDYIFLNYDISLKYSDGTEWQPAEGQTVTVKIPGGWNPEWGYTRVDVDHLNADNSTVKEEFTTVNGTVSLYSDGSVSFETSSFSIFIVTSSGQSVNVSVSGGGGGMGGGTTTTSYSHIIYMTAGSSAVVNFGQSATLQSSTNNTTTISTTTGSNANHTITASSTATAGETATFVYTWKQWVQESRDSWTEQTITAEIEVIIISSDDETKYEYLTNTIEHVQIDIDAKAIVLGYEENQETELALKFTSSTDYSLVKVEDDSAVGYYYQLSYTSSDGTPVTITVRVDENASNLPTGLSYSDIEFEPTGISIKEAQISFDGTFPVGTKTNPIKYIVSVETTMSLTPNDDNDDSTVEEKETVNVSLSNTVDYWSAANECPGLGDYQGKGTHTEVIDGSGIDLSKFSTGATLGVNIAYIVYSDLTKLVNGYTFGSNALSSKNYSFTIYVRPTGSDTWTAIDTISVTVGSTGTATTSITTDANKYVQYFNADTLAATADFKVVETTYNISGYTCQNNFEKISSDSTTSTALTEGVFTWDVSEDTDDSIVIFSIKLKCTNTYTEKISGLSITKQLLSGSSTGSAIVDGNNYFTVKIIPVTLDMETPGDSSITAAEQKQIAISTFNSNVSSEHYKYIIGTDTSVKYTVPQYNSETTDDGYKILYISILAGQTITLTNLPTGTYHVVEVAGTVSSYDYDETVYTAVLTENNVISVTITNICKLTSLTITKTGDYSSYTTIDPNQTFLFTLTGKDADGNAMTLNVTVHGNNSVTIDGLVVGNQYTVTEQTDWSWRYKYISYTTTLVNETVTNGAKITLNATGNTITFTNNRDKIYWLDGDSWCDNRFAGVSSSATE